MRITLILVAICFVCSTAIQAATLRGRVVDENGEALRFANVQIESLQLGKVTDSDGRFEFQNLSAGDYPLRVSMVGYEAFEETVSVNEDDREPIVIRLQIDPMQLEGIEVEAERERAGFDDSKTIRTEVIPGTELVEDADRGTLLSALDGATGLKTRPCAMCGSCGIGMQGLESSYTEVNVDGLPVFIGLGTLYGLDGVSVGDVKRLEMVKGSSSSLYGSGAIAGAVNLVSVSPDPEGSFEARVLSDQYGQSNIFLGGSRLVGKLPMRLTLSAGTTPSRTDTNDDDVTDVPEHRRIIVGYSVEVPFDKSTLRLGARSYWEDRFAGELDWTKDDRGSESVYARDILTNRQELSLHWRRAQVGSWLWSARGALVNHEQDSWYGRQEYDARQRLGLFALTADYLWNERHATIVESGVNAEDYDDNLELASQTDLNYTVPSLVIQHRWQPHEALTLQAGNRAEYYEDDGAIFTPRATAVWNALPMTTFRVSGGLGYRPVTLFSLDIGTEAGFDNVRLADDLEPEETAALSAAVSQRLISDPYSARVDLNLFWTDFENKAIIEHDDGSDIRVSNAPDAYSRGFEVQASAQHLSGWSLKAGFSRSEVRYQTDGKWHDVELQYDYTADGSIGKQWRDQGISAELSAAGYGPQLLPEGRGKDSAARYVLWSANVRKQWARLGVSFGVDNLFDWTQSDSPYVRDPETGRLRPDAALIYGPILGRTFTLSLSYSVGN